MVAMPTVLPGLSWERPPFCRETVLHKTFRLSPRMSTGRWHYIFFGNSFALDSVRYGNEAYFNIELLSKKRK